MGPPIQAQPSAYNIEAPPCGPGINQNEIAIKVDQSVLLSVYDANGDPMPLLGVTPPATGGKDPLLTQTSVEISPASANNCSAYITFQNDAVAQEAPIYRFALGATKVSTIKLAPNSGDPYFIVQATNDPTGWCAPPPEDPVRVAPASFLCPISSSGDGSDFYVGFRNGQFEVSPNFMWNQGGAASSYIHETIQGEDWVWPYHAQIVCAGGRCENGGEQAGLLSSYLLMPVDEPFVLGDAITKKISHPIALFNYNNSLGRPFPDYDWVENWLTLAFAPEAGLTVESDDFRATGMTFTDSGQGWDGVHFKPGSIASLTDVNVFGINSNRFGVRVEDSSAALMGVAVRQLPGATNTTGIVVQGSQGGATLEGVDVREMSKDGVIILNGAQAEVLNSDVLQNVRDGIRVAGGAAAYLYRDPTQATLVGNRVIDNARNGLAVSGGSNATTSGNGAFQGLNTFEGSTNEIRAASGAQVIAGTENYHNRNRILESNGEDPGSVLANGTGTYVTARCDWWDQDNLNSSPPNLTASEGATINAGSWLTSDPYLDPSPWCISIFISGRGSMAGAESGHAGTQDRSLADQLSASYDLVDRPAAQLAELLRIAAAAPDSPEAATAV
ncbi:MAG: hypothetical protein CL433_13150, partial [Acidimicrobiaceae bacterium]|nr:hypothetical protein [Acidimicrobiaceae bacterium]